MPRTRSNRRYGWIPDLPDHRDHYFSVPTLGEAALPAREDMRGFCPPVYDQGNLGSCTAQAIAGALEFDQIKQAEPEFVPSRLQIYYDERVIEGSEDYDAGAYIRDGIKVVASTGAAPESLWPYVISRYAQKPPQSVYDAAKDFTAIRYARLIQTTSQMKGALAAGIPFIIGFSVYENFETPEVEETGIIDMPSGSLLGGHAVLTVGYDDLSQRFIVRNSWGDTWGQAGYFTIPYAYWTDNDLADDLWVIQRVA